MLASELQKLKFEMKEIQDGESFPLKPRNAKTVKQLLKEDRKPKDMESIEYFEVPYMKYGKKQVYAYVREENTIAFDKQDYDSFALEKAKKKEIKDLSKLEKEQKKADSKESERVDLLKKAAKGLQGNVIVFDIETTGFSPAKGEEILQISIVDKDTETLYDSFVHPIEKRSWVPAMRIHGITPKMVSNAPYPSEVADKIRGFFESADVIVGHNVEFDIRFIEQCLHIPVDREKVIDTMKICRLDHDSKKYSLEDAVDHYSPDYSKALRSGAHDSLIDTIATAKVFVKMAEKGMTLIEKENFPDKAIEAIEKTEEIKETESDLYKQLMGEEIEEDFSYF